MGPEIKKKLKELKLSQLWLIDKLYKKSIIVSKEELSLFLSGKRKTPKAEIVTDAAWEILKDYEETERLKACY